MFSPEIKNELNATMTNVVASVRERMQDVRDRVQRENNVDRLLNIAAAGSGGGSLFGKLLTSTAQARADALSMLKTFENGILRLDTTSRLDVLEGRLAPRKWIAAMEEYTKGVVEAGKHLGDNTTGAILSMTFRDAVQRMEATIQRASDLFDKITDPENALTFLQALKWAGIAAVAVAGAYTVAPIITAVASTKSALSGTKPQRRKNRRRK